LLLHSNPGLVLFGGKGFIPFVKEEQTGFFLMPCYPPNFKNPEVYSSEILNLNSAVDDGSFKYSPTLRGEMSAQVMPVRSLNFSFKKGDKTRFLEKVAQQNFHEKEISLADGEREFYSQGQVPILCCNSYIKICQQGYLSENAKADSAQISSGKSEAPACKAWSH
jgi:hypothetical protein